MARRHGIKYATGDEWLCLRPARPLTGIICPGDLQVIDVRAVYLSQTRIANAVRSTPIAGPFYLAFRLLPRLGRLENEARPCR